MLKSCVGMLLLAVACGSPSPAKLKAQYDGTLAISTDGKFVYTANVDANTVTVVDAQAQSVIATVTVGQRPSRIAIGADDRLYVTNRGSRSVSVIQPGLWTQTATIQVGAEPIGLAVASDGNTLYVVSSASGMLDAFDLSQPGFAELWEANLGNAPRGVAVLPNGQLYVTHYKTAVVDLVDGTSGNVLSSIATAVGVDPASAGATVGTLALAPTFRPVGLDSIVVSPDGSRAYLVHRRDLAGIVGVKSGKGGHTPVVVPALTTLDVATSVALDDATLPDKDFPAPIIFPASAAVLAADQAILAGAEQIPTIPGAQVILCPSGSSNDSVTYGSPPPAIARTSAANSAGTSADPVEALSGRGWTQGPVAAVLDGQGQHLLYVANQSSNNVSVIDPMSRTSNGADNGVVGLAPVGLGPTGLAISPDGSTLYVHNAFGGNVSFLSITTLAATGLVTVSNDEALNDDVVGGRELFYSAVNPIMTVSGGGVACESCHLEGGNDGNVWQFPFGPRKTPSLLGRKIAETAPYHWDGTETDFNAFFFETIQQRMGGQGVNPGQAGQLETFMQELATPDNPFVQPGGLTTSQASGKELFMGKAACVACHSGPDLTDNSFHDVGTLVVVNPDGNPDDVCRLDPAAGACATGNCLATGANPANAVHGFNTPSLLGAIWGAPYLHDGSAATLEDRILSNPGNVHGNTAVLSADEVDDLVQYLQTL
jgi:YVTN family beta-propeller protein